MSDAEDIRAMLASFDELEESLRKTVDSFRWRVAAFIAVQISATLGGLEALRLYLEREEAVYAVCAVLILLAVVVALLAMLRLSETVRGARVLLAQMPRMRAEAAEALAALEGDA